MILRNYRPDPDNDAYKTLLTLLPTQNHSAEDALQQFEKLLTDIKFVFDMDDEQSVELRVSDAKREILLTPLEKNEVLLKMEETYSIQIPRVFCDFVLKHGLISIDRARQMNDEGDVSACQRIPILSFYNHKDTELFPNILDLPRAIGNNFSNDFMTRTYSSEDIESFRKNYFVFGHYNHNDQVYDYLFFTKDGKFGSVYFQDEDYIENKVILDTLLNKSVKLETFDQLMSRFIGKTMIEFADTLSDY